MAAFLANVGVNSSHAARSRLFEDGTFELVPIPERLDWRPPMVRIKGRAVHLDPDLESPRPTYGDNCRRAGRAFSLRRAKPNDLIFFLARLCPVNGNAGFYLVGALEITEVLEDVTRDPGPGWWDANAHVLRARAGDKWDSFWIFRGTPKTRRFTRAIPFTRGDADAVFESAWRWRPTRSDLQTIGSYTRTVRRIEGPGEEWLRASLR
ncbi:MAG TPA: hypothetical protein VHQ03_12690, partial [Candidatus Dormibacteraeota bacterium]|nr:hypothetical protein [Candidatus Dormibacteraeota bacterium]